MNTRRRGAELEAALLNAAWAVLVSRGYDGFTYEAIAEQAATSRPVLYRRWPERQDLLIATLRAHWTPITPPDTGSLRDDAVALLSELGSARSHLVTILTVQLHDYFVSTGSGFGDLRDALRTTEDVGPFEVFVQRAVERGEIPARHRSSRLVNMPFDLVRAEMLMTREPVPRDAIEEIVDDLWLPLLS